jgi:DNA-binding NarL/FixJ family response regulator
MYPDAGVLLLTEVCKGDFYFPHGYARGVSMLSNACSPATLRHAAHIVAEKKVRVTDRRLFDRMLEDGRVAAAEKRKASQIKLTPREREIVALMARGLTDAQIARKLVLSRTAIQTHVSNVLNKGRISTRFELALYAMATGVIEYSVSGSSSSAA